jgi:hypothetical protein
VRRFVPAVTAAVLLLALPAPGSAQFGAIEAFARRVSDLSFYYTIGGLAGASDGLDRDAWITAFGVELLFEVAEITRPLPGAEVPERADSVRRVWKEMEIVHTEEGVDTINRYEIEAIPPPPPPSESIWVMEMGIGYGQVQGFRLEDPSLEMNVAIRDLPSVSLYASYEPWGNYFGLRTGFMRTQALQVLDTEGVTFSGNAEAFLFGGLAGYAFAFADLWVFLEGGYTLRDFHSVAWDGPFGGPQPPLSLPRELDVSGWFFTTGMQFPFR